MLFPCQFFIYNYPKVLVSQSSFNTITVYNTKDSVLTCLFAINIYFVLEIFSESSFAAIGQSITFVIPEFCNFPGLLSLWTKTVSSAKSLVFIKFEFDKPFVNI